MGKNEKIPNNALTLFEILNEILSQIQVAQKIVGGKVVILECEDNVKLISLYERYGFCLINTKYDENNLKTMYLIPKFL